ncbi:MAG TPA: sigma-54 dependent transcriptional regulator [Ignavibacteriaceae bacterium]|nr:sigma-54 dependent transcriptional regulator [Ignavibacteriaceae bacterium]
MKLLIIEDEKITRISLSNTLKEEGYEVSTAENGEEGLIKFKAELPDIVITDLRLPRLNGMDILTSIISIKPDCKVILITAFATVETAVKALKIGAYDYLTKPFSPEELLSILRNIKQLQVVISENIELKKRLNLLENKTIIGNSPVMKKLVEMINHVAQNDSTILIEGESGTGKEIIARALHQASPRRNENFITVSCSSIPENLFESLLFGHEKGAFTSAIKRHIGYVESAHKGTLFLDDIDDFPLVMQIKLLRVLQEKEITRVGGNENIEIDTRIICATKIDLKQKVEKKEFREDLYYRLNIVPVKIPPLRERKEDIPQLLEYFFKKYKAEDKLKLISNQVLSKLLSYDWYGNVRELENIVQRIIALSFSGSIDITMLDLPEINKSRFKASSEKEYPALEEYLFDKEKEIIEWALNKSNNNVTRAAKLLKIPRTTLNSKLERLALADRF